MSGRYLLKSLRRYILHYTILGNYKQTCNIVSEVDHRNRLQRESTHGLAAIGNEAGSFLERFRHVVAKPFTFIFLRTKLHEFS